MSTNPAEPYIARLAQELCNVATSHFARGGAPDVRKAIAWMARRYPVADLEQAAHYMVTHRLRPA